MPRFFIDYVPQERAFITGEDARHIARSLRMQPGESLILCDSIGTDYNGEIESVADDQVVVRVLNFCRSVAEPSALVTVYQGLPKADKMDSIVQKSVETGAVKIVPVMTARCVSKPDEKAAAKKIVRWQKIAEEAAKQSGRGIIPQVAPLTSFRQAVEQAAKAGKIILFFEGGGQSIAKLVNGETRELAVFIGPEGGFEQSEVDFAVENGAAVGTLGARILRTETAPIAALSAIMLATGNM
ncbi:16S rRNA (uracil(1498)-N(3))-methyltransferase [Caproiciproducens faecalis]|uniref:Ribosomal RNA small subunit methyltransferase E n=1 Tax=Caproiciproducens faecalis TaxID=2820301 RepID=A0ABS7DRB5_9FIRM|nr:16S rRNA (uracil(1498)-N(3))-methyltransferase [Caproiciproducens faecalis]MBW7573121.1 16S rRNA (uracil(1498)-N(3))-methyltransferase [Caproiciproducens faecalis]